MSPILGLINELDFTVEHSCDPSKVFVSSALYVIFALFEIAKKVNISSSPIQNLGTRCVISISMYRNIAFYRLKISIR